MPDGTQHAEQWFTAVELAGIAGMPRTHSAVIRMSKRQGWKHRAREGRGGGREFALSSLPPQTQAALLLRNRGGSDLAHAPQPRERTKRNYGMDAINSAWDQFGRAPTKIKDIGFMRARALQTVDRLIAAGVSKVDAVRQVAAELDVVPSSIYAWRERVGTAHRSYWAGLLLPQWAGRTATVDIPERIWDLFKADYLRLEAPQASACYRRMEEIAAKHGTPIPSLRTFERRIAREIPRAVLVLAREGEEALAKLYPAQERDRSVFNALEAVNADGHKFDVFVRWQDGSVGRPLMVAFQDLYSGLLLSYRVTRSENADSVRLALADLVTAYGIPSHAWLDNGRAFASKWMSGGAPTRYRFKVKAEDPVGVFVALGMQVHWTTPFHGQAKPIERAFLDLCETVAKHPAFAGAWTGNNPMAKPENYGSNAIAIEVFQKVLAVEIERHNNRPGRESRVCAGRSLRETFDESYRRSTIRRATDEQMRLLWLPAEAVTANQADGSVHLAGHRYWHEALSPFAGQKLVLRFDPDALDTKVLAYTLSGTFIGAAEFLNRVSFADTEAGAKHARSRNAFKGDHRAALDAERRMAASDVARELLGEEVVGPAVPVREVRRAARVESAAQIEQQRLERTGTDDHRALEDWLISIQPKKGAFD